MINDTGGNKTYGLLGRNINYSLSPVMHNAAFKHFEIPAEYKIFDIEENKIDAFFQEHVLTGEISGFNVTVPYKIKIKEILEGRECCRIDDYARFMGAINTVEVMPDEIKAFNTDGIGFASSVREDLGFDLMGKKVSVIGAGGAGRAISIYICTGNNDGSLESLNVVDVDEERVSSLRDTCKKYSSVRFKSDVEEIKKSDLIVNATPLGTKKGDPLPVDLNLLTEGMAVYDLVYARETELIKRAKEKGLITSGGLGMLVNQGAAAFEIWTGKPFEEARKIMKQAALEALERK